MAKPRTQINGVTLKLIADIVCCLPEGDVRAIVANHFCQELNRRVISFSPSFWNIYTGGKLTGPTRLKEQTDG